MGINMKLAVERGLSEEAIAKIVVRQRQGADIFKEMESIDHKDVTNRRQLLAHAESLTRIEYELQELWGFEKDARYHHWFTIPHCTCPVMDNTDRLGTSFQVRSVGCIYHGGDKPSHGGDRDEVS